ncbi:MAG TPA: gliding motility-associated C-terminal domain-containing protein, partial [Luteibaculaceae bacterium]|nr:gliding motility-associated C-terminal domain-containing protein [Luteibaculaceae bacterium]
RLPRAGVGDTAAACEDETDFDLYTTLTGNFDREGRWELAMLPPYDANLNATVNGNRTTYFKGPLQSDFDVAAFMTLINSSTTPFFASRPSSFPPFVRLKYTVEDTTNYGPNPPLCRDSVTFAVVQVSKIFSTPSPKSAVFTEVCRSVSQFNLNSLVNNLDFFPFTEDDRLVWTENSGTITAADIVNDSIIAPSSLPAGEYTFTLSIQTAACDPIVVNNIRLRIVSVPNAGTSNSVTVCTNSTPVDIRTIVGGETGGSITKVQPTTPINGQGVTSYNPIDGPGTYVFEYRVVKAACPNSTSTANATIIVQAPPVTNGNQTANVCFGEQVAMRNVVPTTDPIATFSPNSTSGDCAVAIATNSPYNSAVFNAGLAGFALGATCVVDYTADNGVCPAVTNQITINIAPRPDAGLDVVDTVCSTNSTYALVPGGTPTAGGSFSSSSPAVSGSNFNATLVAAPATVTAFYVVGGGACPRDTAFFTLRVEKAPEAGTDATIELCAEGSRVDMRTLLNGQVDLNGNFVAQVGAQQAFLGGSSSEIFDPVVFFNNFPGVSTFSFNHVVRGVNCPDDIATLTIRLVPAPRSGRGDTTIFLCQNQGTYSLFNALGLPGDYDLGGTWTSDGGPTSSFIDPSSYNPDTVQFVYSVPSAKCGPSNTVVTAIISAAPNSGADRADTLFLCAQGLTNLNQFLINGSNGGRWELHSGTAPTGNFATGQVILTSGDAGKRGTFRYITSAPGCANDTAFFRFNINGTPSPLADPNLVVCRTDNPTNLSGAYANFPAGGTFSLQPKAGTNNQAAITAGALSGNLFYSDLAGNGRYEFTLTTPGNGCVSVTQTLTVTVVGPGIDTSFTVCSNQNPIDIYDLTRADGITGVWNTTASVGTVPANLLVGNIFFPRRGVVGTTYTNTLTGNAVGCNAIARITIVDTISVSNVAGTNPAVDILCDKSTNSYQVRFRIRGGVAPYFVSGTNGSLAGDIFTSDPIAFGGIYTLFISSSTSCGSLTLRGSSECGDADNDGIFDQADLDDDNDGLPDLLEAGGLADANGDADGDGTPNYKDADFCSSQGGSMAGLVCALYDFDGDGIINQYDLDSDNDGISDLFEGLNASAALALESTPVDGMVVLNEPGAVKNGWTDAAESFFGPLNFTNLFNRVQKTTTGVADFLNLDSDGDSIADITEGAGSITVLPNDTDGDGTFDFRDLDSDDDGVSDYYESGLDINFVAVPNSDNDLLPDFRDTDSDNDGLLDGIDSRVAMFAGIPEDFDGDGLFNFQDDDSDNDNILDSDEKGPDATPRISFAGNTNPDYLNLDTDNDGICDIFEGHLPGQGKFDRVSDVDNDGDEDYRDRDTDNDGILDAIEGGVALGSCLEPVNTNGGLFHDYRSIDSDGDGLGDRFEAGASTAVPADSDGDGVYDFQDFDSDNDCIPDSVEAIAPYDSKFTAGLNVAYKFDASSALPDYLNTDSDGDGIDDNVEAGANCASPVDSDGDGFPDFRDLDSDNDGASDRIENTGDCDGDGVPNFADAGDNCEILTDVPEGFSPNGDGVNDFFVIPAISEFPQASLKVYNRWGQLIFESNSYQNNWDGTFQKSGEDVPQGTYFYLLDLGLGDKAQKGTIYINR